MNLDPIVIVGAGLAGYSLAKELRKRAPAQPIRLITADSGVLYSKPMLSNALAQKQNAQTLVQASAADQAEKLLLDLRSHCTVKAIHAEAHRIETDQGGFAYRHLVLALGATPRQLEIPGAECGFSVNHLDDYARFRSHLNPGAKVLILGAGLVGCEFANDLASSGHQVSVVETSTRALQRMAPVSLSKRLQRSLEALGVEWHFGSGAKQINQLVNGYEVILDNDTQVRADLILSATGLLPQTALAQAAGLCVQRGIVVDAQLASNAADIYALGDCIELNGMLLPYVLPLMQQARVLASILTGTPTQLTLPAMPVAVKTPACPLVLCPPAAAAEGDWQCERDDDTGAIHHFVGLNNTLLGFALAGDACGQRRQLAGHVPAIYA
jgi:rubredoxin---NAD+ reductase